MEPIELTDEAIDDCITTAFEGGSNYWIEKAVPVDGDYKGAGFASEVVSRGGELEIHISEADGQIEVLTKAKMLNGFKLYESKNGKPFDVEFCETDATDADEVLQLALFDKVIFG